MNKISAKKGLKKFINKKQKLNQSFEKKAEEEKGIQFELSNEEEKNDLENAESEQIENIENEHEEDEQEERKIIQTMEIIPKKIKKKKNLKKLMSNLILLKKHK